MTTEQRNTMASLISRITDGNHLLLEILNKMQPNDQAYYIPKVQQQLDNTKDIICQVQDMSIINNPSNK